jgi:hypothetical protein
MGCNQNWNFVYLSDACIPPMVTDDMVYHDKCELVMMSGTSGGGSWDPVAIVLLEDLVNAKNGVWNKVWEKCIANFLG